MNTAGTGVFRGIKMSELAYRVFKSNVNNPNLAMQSINEVLFYGGGDEETIRKVGLSNLFCIYYLIVHANVSIDVCVHSLVSDTIADCLVTAKRKKGMKIRVAIHRSDDLKNLQLFSQHGIEVKVITSENLEHDFVLVDAKKDKNEAAVAILGALDYDTSKINCNRDNTLITSDKVVVRTLNKEFDRIWKSGPIIIINQAVYQNKKPNN